MKYQVKVNEEDYIRFNIFHVNHSREGKRAKKMMQLRFPILSLLLIFTFYIVGAEKIFLLTETIFMAVFCVIWCTFLPKIVERSVRKQIHKMKAGGRLPYHTDAEIDFQESMIVEKSEQGEVHIKYQDIENIYLEQDYLYIYFGVTQAFILPRYCLGEDTERLVDYVTKKREEYSSEVNNTGI